jgi:hypothetical protein
MLSSPGADRGFALCGLFEGAALRAVVAGPRVIGTDWILSDAAMLRAGGWGWTACIAKPKGASFDMPSMRAMVVKQPGGEFELEERAVPEPGFDQAVVRVHACGVCHSDVLAKEGGYPGVSHPGCPGPRDRG